MLKFLTLFLLVATVNCLYILDEEEINVKKEKIVGGEYTDMKDVPYLAQILQNRKHKNIHICGGSIITNQWILTAAHCVLDAHYNSDTFKPTYQAKDKISIVTGKKLSGRGQKHIITKIVYRKNYNETTHVDDIALIKVKKQIPFSENQKAISIATELPKDGDKMKISGLGLIDADNGISAKSVKTAIVPVISNEECEARYRSDHSSIITSKMFCAGVGTDDSCQGDSGGPGVINGKLSGVIIGGNGCATTEYSSVYTRLHRYFDWISRHTGLELPTSSD